MYLKIVERKEALRVRKERFSEVSSELNRRAERWVGIMSLTIHVIDTDCYGVCDCSQIYYNLVVVVRSTISKVGRN
jgi:hypothetical protein